MGTCLGSEREAGAVRTTLSNRRPCISDLRRKRLRRAIPKSPCPAGTILAALMVIGVTGSCSAVCSPLGESPGQRLGKQVARGQGVASSTARHLPGDAHRHSSSRPQGVEFIRSARWKSSSAGRGLRGDGDVGHEISTRGPGAIAVRNKRRTASWPVDVGDEERRCLHPIHCFCRHVCV